MIQTRPGLAHPSRAESAGTIRRGAHCAGEAREPRALPAPIRQVIRERTLSMHSIIYLVGLIVIVLALLSLVGLA
jgi:hypothetical protein